MEKLFISTKIKSSLSVEPKDLNSNLNKIIVKKIKQTVEGKCIKNGYVRTNSVKLIKRSLGQSLTSHFNGNVIFHVEYLVDLCNPLEGASIECSVINSNKMGVLAEINGVDDSPLNILLAKQHHIDNPEFEDLRERDIINIRVLGKRYEFGDSQITIIGLLESEYIKNYEETNKEEQEEPLEVMSDNDSSSSNSLSFQDSNSSPEPDVQEPDVQEPDVQEPDVQESDVQEPDVQEPDVQESKKPSKEPVEELLNDQSKIGEGINNQLNSELDLDFELKPLQL